MGSMGYGRGGLPGVAQALFAGGLPALLVAAGRPPDQESAFCVLTRNAGLGDDGVTSGRGAVGNGGPARLLLLCRDTQRGCVVSVVVCCYGVVATG